MNVADHYKIRCKCVTCGKKQVRRIADVLNGAKCCLTGGLKSPKPCAGELNYYTDDQEDALGNMLNIVGYLAQSPILNTEPKLAELVDTLADDVGHWFEPEPTPQQMGWVDSRGLP